MGLIPGPDSVTGLLDIPNGYTIAGYVGYDDNQPMKGPHMALYGSSGALPLWMDTAEAIVKTENFKTRTSARGPGLQPAAATRNPGPAGAESRTRLTENRPSAEQCRKAASSIHGPGSIDPGNKK